MAITVTDSFLTEKAMDYAKLSDLAYAQWNNSVLVAGQPVNRDSGTFRGRRGIWGGCASVRSILYMSAMSAIRFNPIIKEFYQRLRSAGKIHKVEVMACMRKLYPQCHDTEWALLECSLSVKKLTSITVAHSSVFARLAFGAFYEAIGECR
jgi:hypothetical protein